MPSVAKSKSVLLVDPLAGDRGHLLDDDLFLAECLQPLAEELLVATSPTSVSNLQQHLKVAVHRFQSDVNQTRWPRGRLLRLIRALPCAEFEHVVFQSFEEVSTLLFMLLHPQKHVHLIVTNNLRPDRLQRHPLLGKWLLRQVFLRAASIIVHSRHEVVRIQELVEGIDPQKIVIKPFHKFAQHTKQEVVEKPSPPRVLYLGPELAHKTIQPLLELIRRDTEKRFCYQFCAMREVPKQLEQLAKESGNVEIGKQYLSDEQYYRLFREAALVMMTHDEKYEGLLSGAFCDAVASGTPVISRPLAPITEYFEDFGPLGYLVDFQSPGWCDQILAADLNRDSPRFASNMVALRKSCEMPAVRAVFSKLLGRASAEAIKAA